MKYKDIVFAFVRRHKRILVLKCAIAAALIAAHFVPHPLLVTVTNLIWLIAF